MLASVKAFNSYLWLDCPETYTGRLPKDIKSTFPYFPSFIKKTKQNKIFLKGNKNTTISILMSPCWGLASQKYKDEKAPPIRASRLGFSVLFQIVRSPGFQPRWSRSLSGSYHLSCLLPFSGFPVLHRKCAPWRSLPWYSDIHQSIGYWRFSGDTVSLMRTALYSHW